MFKQYPRAARLALFFALPVAAWLALAPFMLAAHNKAARLSDGLAQGIKLCAEVERCVYAAAATLRAYELGGDESDYLAAQAAIQQAGTVLVTLNSPSVAGFFPAGCLDGLQKKLDDLKQSADNFNAAEKILLLVKEANEHSAAVNPGARSALGANINFKLVKDAARNLNRKDRAARERDLSLAALVDGLKTALDAAMDDLAHTSAGLKNGIALLWGGGLGLTLALCLFAGFYPWACIKKPLSQLENYALNLACGRNSLPIPDDLLPPEFIPLAERLQEVGKRLDRMSGVVADTVEGSLDGIPGGSVNNPPVL